MSTWWYVVDDNKNGPVSIEELKELINNSTINNKTMVWREGMETWVQIGDIEELQPLMTPTPPPLPPKQTLNKIDLPMANRWARFFARIFDLWWETILVVMVSAYVLSRYSANFVEWINSPGTSQAFGILCLPVAMIFDAVLHRIFGNTPGKLLLGLKVTDADGKALSFSQYLLRNISVWIKGLAFGIPLVNLATMSIQCSRLGKGLEASYDESAGYTVRTTRPGWVRKIAFGISFLCLFSVMSVLNMMDKEADREALMSSNQKQYSWVNPATGKSAKIDSKWKFSTTKVNNGMPTYVFNESAGYAFVILAMERFPGYSLNEYAQGFRKGTSSTMSFSDGGRIMMVGGRQAWEASGEMLSIDNNRLRVQISQFDTTFWRVVSVQTIPYAYTNEMVDKLKASLWSTLM